MAVIVLRLFTTWFSFYEIKQALLSSGCFLKGILPEQWLKKKLLIQMDVIFLGILLQGHWQPNDTWTPAKVIPENKGSLRRRQERWLCQVLPCISAMAVLVQIDTCIIYSQPFPTTCKLCLLGKGQKWGNMRHLGGQFSSLRLYAAPYRLAVFQPLFYSSVKQLSLLKQVGWL